MEERPSEMVLLQQLEEGGPDPLVFVLNANLLAMVKLVNCEYRRLAERRGVVIQSDRVDVLQHQPLGLVCPLWA